MEAAVVATDASATVTFWNRHAELLFGWPEEEALGRDLRDLAVAPEIVARVRAGEPWQGELPIRRRDGSEARIFSTLSPITEGGAVVGIAGVAVVVGEGKRTEEELEGGLVSIVSHELRTPLAAIYGAALTLRRDDPRLGEEQRERLLGVIASESSRLARVVDDVLWASRLESGTLRAWVERCDAAELARVVVEAARTHLPENVTLELTASAGLPPVAADPDKVRQVLVNLVDNAVKYSPGGGAVELALDRNGPHVRFAVRDEGLGVPAAEQERIFEKFYRLDPEGTRSGGGTGLGLYICRELVRCMDGRISVSSREGEGSTFLVELPAAVG